MYVSRKPVLWAFDVKTDNKIQIMILSNMLVANQCYVYILDHLN